MNNARPEFVDPVKASIGTVDEEALRTYASCIMDSECTESYLIAAGTFNIIYFLGFCDGREAIARVNRKAKESDQTLLLNTMGLGQAQADHLGPNPCIPR